MLEWEIVIRLLVHHRLRLRLGRLLHRLLWVAWLLIYLLAGSLVSSLLTVLAFRSLAEKLESVSYDLCSIALVAGLVIP